MEYTTKSTEETKKLGERFSADLAGGETIALSGDLGSGKTTFVQGLASGLGVSARIVSPTFLILKHYSTQKNFDLFHADLYRIEKNIKKELENIGVVEIINTKKDVLVVEWAEKAKDFWPENTIWIKFDILKSDERTVYIK